MSLQSIRGKKKGLIVKADYNIIFDGDSLTAEGPEQQPGYYASQLCALLRADGKKVAASNYAIGGQTSTQCLSDCSSQIVPSYSQRANKNIVIYWVGANDIFQGTTGMSYTTVLNNLKSYYNQCKAAGFKLILIGLHQYNNVPLSKDDSSILNNLYLNNWNVAPAFADAFVNIRADIRLSDSTNTTYYVDYIHLKYAGGGVVAELVKPFINTV